ncbi:MAG: VanW family protein [Lachnospiraceae bacterium]|nr:VanW family protein [Lachnospiraceae bacterium]
MKNWKIAVALMGVLVCAAGWNKSETVYAAQESTIKQGIFAEGIELSGMTKAEAGQAITDYVDGLKEVAVTLVAADNKKVVTTAGALGITWANPELVQEAMDIGTQGNVIERYKIMKDLEHESLTFDIELGFDVAAINDILTNECVKYDRKAVNMALKLENGKFQVIEGQIGYKLDVEHSIDIVYDYLTGEWDGKAVGIALNVAEDQPKGTAEELMQVRDVLGSFTTSFTTSGTARTANVTNGCVLINGTTLYPGEEFSTYEAVAPFSQANGYYMAGSYLNGKVVDSIGGGICQVSTTLYNAVLLAELEVTERHNHSMIVTYVDPSADAAIAESSGKDFRFVNNTDSPIYIEGIIKDKQITINIYGKEVRPANRKVSYVSEILETIMPPADMIYQDAVQPIGYFLNGESAHIGYKSRLWKVVLEDGKEVSREQVNKSNYKMSPRSATVGVATDDPNAYNEMQAAIGTGSIDHVKNVIALLTGQATQPENSGEVINEEPAE